MKNPMTLTLLALVSLLVSCNNDDNVNPKSQEIVLIAATPWSHAEVVHATDGDLSDQYKNFAISFTKKAEDGYDGTFLISNGGYAFPENTGKWKFNDELNAIILDSGREIQYDVKEDALHLDFTVAAPGGRINGLSGHFVFDLKPL